MILGDLVRYGEMEWGSGCINDVSVESLEKYKMNEGLRVGWKQWQEDLIGREVEK
ncbi:hypothetical protein Scep_016680 [Stephania cephalantha]|uniref:Uncharacterized protein n=1 Tax=Stephania cephalantha TaxID=152367 RepID=A0AAP0IN99_9MAGN